VQFVNAMAEEEISATREEATLFRLDAASSKCFRYYTRLVALPYLWASLARLLYELHLSVGQTQQMEMELEEAKQKKSGLGQETIVLSGMEVRRS
jgi:hypothetical protein